MSSRGVRHFAVILPAVFVTMVGGAVLLGSAVEYFTVGTSRVGLDSPTGAGVAIGGSLLAMAAVAVLLFLALGMDQDDGRDDDGDGGDDVPPPPPRDPFGEPLWWPQFEQDLDAYVRSPAGERSGRERVPALY